MEKENEQVKIKNNEGKEQKVGKDAGSGKSGFLEWWKTLPDLLKALAAVMGAAAVLIPVLLAGPCRPEPPTPAIVTPEPSAEPAVNPTPILTPTFTPTPAPTPTPLPTTYEVVVTTGCRDDAGTDAYVRISLYGSKGKIEKQLLDTPEYNDHEQCHTDRFRIAPQGDIGDLQMITIWHDNLYDYPSWFLEKVTIRNLRTDAEWDFPCGRWLAKGKEDGSISRNIYPNGRCQ